MAAKPLKSRGTQLRRPAKEMNVAEVAAMLSGNDTSYRAAVAAAAHVEGGDLIIELVRMLDDSKLPNAERERRLTAVYTRVAPSSDQEDRIANVASAITNAVLKNALVQLLPARLKSRAFQSAHPAQAVERAMPVIPAVAATTESPPIVESAIEATTTEATHVLILSRELDDATIRN